VNKPSDIKSDGLYYNRKELVYMSRYKNGNPNKTSRFICLSCLNENMVGDGMQRIYRQRENNHRKELYCIICKAVTKNLEVRYCDDFDEKMEKAKELHEEYYNEII
jgi:hypothetical protein